MARDSFNSASDDSLAQRVLDILRRRWLLAAAVFAGVLATAGAVAFSLPDLYKAQALVLIERPVSEAVMRAPVAGELESRLYVIKQEILSRERLTQLIDRYNLYPRLREKAGFEDVLNQARQDVVVEPSGPEQVSGRVKTVSFTLSFPADAPAKAAEVTNAIADFYIQQNNLMRTQEATQTTDLLEKELAEASAELERQERALRDFATTNAGELPAAAAATMAQIESLNNRLSNNSANKRAMEASRDRLLEATPASTVASRAAADASPETLARLSQINDLEGKLAAALTEFTAAHPTVRQLQGQLNELKRAHETAEAAEQARRATEEALAAAQQSNAAAATVASGRRTVAYYDAEIARLRDEERELIAQIDVLQSRLQSNPGTQQTFMLVNRDYATAKDRYDSLRSRYEEARMVAEVETGGAGERFRVLDAAIPPEGPSAPNRPRLLIMGFLLALAAAVGAVMLREQLDPSFHSVDELREFTAVPVLVSIPPMGPAPRGRVLRYAFATVSTVAVIVLVATAAAYVARDNDQLVRMIAF